MTSQSEAIPPVEILSYITQSIVQDPQAVRVEAIPGNEEVIIELRVSSNDIGRVIGKNGSVVQALRSLLTAMGKRAGVVYTLEVID